MILPTIVETITSVIMTNSYVVGYSKIFPRIHEAKDSILADIFLLLDNDRK